MLIEDQELRELYAAASTEHLDNLEAGVLCLEKSPCSACGMKDLLREIHSLKGDSRMLGVENAQSLAQLVEALLKQVDAGQSEVTPEFGDRLYQGLDALREVVCEAVNDIPVEVDILAVMTQLMEATVVEKPAEASATVEADTADTAVTEAGLAEVAVLDGAAEPNEAALQAEASLTVDELELDLPEAVSPLAEFPGGEEDSVDHQAALAADMPTSVASKQVEVADGVESLAVEETTPEQAALADAFLKLAGDLAAETADADDAGLEESLLATSPDDEVVETADQNLAESASPAVDVWDALEPAALEEEIHVPELALIDSSIVDADAGEAPELGQALDGLSDFVEAEVTEAEVAEAETEVAQQSTVAADMAVVAHQSAVAEGIEIPAAEEATPEHAAMADAFLQLAGDMAAGIALTETDDSAAVEALLATASSSIANATTTDQSEIESPASAVDAWDAVEAMVGDEALPVQEMVPSHRVSEEIVSEDGAPTVEAVAGSYGGFIDDLELRGLYEAASAEHLATLEMGCLHLERNPEDFSQFKELLRAAHSLKGDSRMLGVQDAESLTHQLETLLQEIEQGQLSVTPALCDRLYAGIDGLRQIARGAVHGNVPELTLDQMMDRLMGAGDAEQVMEAQGLAIAEATQSNATQALQLIEPAAPQPVESTVESLPAIEQRTVESAVAEPTGSEPVQPQPKLAKSTPRERSTPTASAVDTQTIRVASAKLDNLVTQASELAVTKRRIVEWSDQVTSMLDLWEGWSQDSFAQRNIFSRIQEELPPETAQLLRNLQEQNLKKVETLGTLVQRFRSQTSEGGARLDAISNDLEAGILSLRMLPLSNVFNLFPRMVRDLSRQQQKNIDLQLEGGDTQVDKRILEDIKDPLSHLLRNAVDHGIEQPEERAARGKASQAVLSLRGFQQGSSIIIEIQDDGRGLDVEKIKQTALRRGLVDEARLAQMSSTEIHALIFEAGFSTKTTVTEISGRGVGMDVVKTNIERLKGSIKVDSEPGTGCTFRLTLNPSLATTDALILTVNQVSYALPIESVDRMVTVDREDIFTVKGNLATTIAGESVSVAWLSDLLGLPTRIPDSAKEAERLSQKIPCVVVQIGADKIGLFVDELLDQQEILLKSQSKLLKRVRNIAGSTILGNGEVCLVLNHRDLFLTMLKQNGAIEKFDQVSASLEQKTRVLLVEDSLPIRTQMKRILEGSGYLVTATVDGQHGYNTLRAEESSFDIIISDVEMPNLTGLELAAKVRMHAEYSDLPFILITTLAKEEDRKRGLDAGADAYLTKGDFDQSLLLDTLKGLVRS